MGIDPNAARLAEELYGDGGDMPELEEPRRLPVRNHHTGEVEHLTDVEFMRRPDLWPNAVVLPVKRDITKQDGVGALLCGLAEGEPAPRVYLRNMWDANTSFSDCRKLNYESLEALVEAGWRVD